MPKSDLNCPLHLPEQTTTIWHNANQIHYSLDANETIITIVYLEIKIIIMEY